VGFVFPALGVVFSASAGCFPGLGVAFPVCFPGIEIVSPGLRYRCSGSQGLFSGSWEWLCFCCSDLGLGDCFSFLGWTGLHFFVFRVGRLFLSGLGTVSRVLGVALSGPVLFSFMIIWIAFRVYDIVVSGRGECFFRVGGTAFFFIDIACLDTEIFLSDTDLVSFLPVLLSLSLSLSLYIYMYTYSSLSLSGKHGDLFFLAPQAGRQGGQQARLQGGRQGWQQRSSHRTCTATKKAERSSTNKVMLEFRTVPQSGNPKTKQVQ